MAYTLSKLSKKCKACSKVGKCNRKEMELCALAELPTQNIASAIQSSMQDATMPLMREQIKNPLSPFAYKDELEKALNDYHFGNRFMNSAT